MWDPTRRFEMLWMRSASHGGGTSLSALPKCVDILWSSDVYALLNLETRVATRIGYLF